MFHWNNVRVFTPLDRYKSSSRSSSSAIPIFLALNMSSVAIPSQAAVELDATSDAIDEGLSHFIYLYSDVDSFPVNVLKGRMWDDETVFDRETDKSQFRNYDDACDRVKTFYKEQHGL